MDTDRARQRMKRSQQSLSACRPSHDAPGLDAQRWGSAHPQAQHPGVPGKGAARASVKAVRSKRSKRRSTHLPGQSPGPSQHPPAPARSAGKQKPSKVGTSSEWGRATMSLAPGPVPTPPNAAEQVQWGSILLQQPWLAWALQLPEERQRQHGAHAALRTQCWGQAVPRSRHVPRARLRWVLRGAYLGVQHAHLAHQVPLGGCMAGGATGRGEVSGLTGR